MLDERVCWKIEEKRRVQVLVRIICFGEQDIVHVWQMYFWYPKYMDFVSNEASLRGKRYSFFEDKK